MFVYHHKQVITYTHLPQRLSSAPLGQSLCPLHCKAWGRHSLMFPHGNWPSGHLASTSTLLLVTSAEEEMEVT